MFTEKFKELAQLSGLDTEKIIEKCDLLEDKYQGEDKEDVTVGTRFLTEIAESFDPKEISFLLMSAISPASIEQEPIDDFLSAMGFEKVDVKLIEDKTSEAKEINEKYNAPEPLALQHERNALGYNHNLTLSSSAIGIDVAELTSKIDSYIVTSKDLKVSERIEFLERNFTRKELSYLYDLITSKEDITVTKRKPRKTTTKIK